MRARMRAAAADGSSPASTNTKIALAAVPLPVAVSNLTPSPPNFRSSTLLLLLVTVIFVIRGLRNLDVVRDAMHSAISSSKTELLDAVLHDFSQGYFALSRDHRRRLLLILAKGYDLNRKQARELMDQHLGLQLPVPSAVDGVESDSPRDEAMLSAFYRIERNLRQALKPAYEVLFERLNNHPGGLRFLTTLRADILSFLQDENVASLRALDASLKEKLTTWLSPVALELHQITWDDPASLLEKIVAYEAVHPISNLLDLKRRLGEVLWDDPPISESEASCALFYSISSTQSGLAGINLGKFLIKWVITLVKRDMPHICTFATLSPIPGYMQWLLCKLASDSPFMERLIEPNEESALINSSRAHYDISASRETYAGKSGAEVMLNMLTSTNYDWSSNAEMLSALKPPLMRLCARYLLQEKKRGKALDSVANFHLQNGAMIERINWMADRSEKGLRQSGGIMVNYVYRVEDIEENAQAYFRAGHIQASENVCCYVKEQEVGGLKENDGEKPL
ncbi:unnamed protein product [Linum tenue]|uniref:Malonyl-CoA decarboxylase n=1 Tax=Linum tenue TaxID=586396 RepID=A0AAV0RYG8_9ROSI|nr:unnamed protein product [Linum tenue]